MGLFSLSHRPAVSSVQGPSSFFRIHLPAGVGRVYFTPTVLVGELNGVLPSMKIEAPAAVPVLFATL